MALQCSVIVPSYNRRTTLEMVLEGLAAQQLHPDTFEVIVVLDGGNDDSPQMLAEWQQRGRIANLRWITQANSGQATARNTGAQSARSPVLVFLDDDVVPEANLLATHLQHHGSGERIVVLGDCLVVRTRNESLYHLGLWAWWEEKYHRRALPGRISGYRDFCAGNFSLRREDFLALGGFQSAFRGYGGEDYEFGHRLLRSGVRFIAERNARALHYHRTSVPGALRTTRQEAHGDVLFARRYPEVLNGLGLMYLPDTSARWPMLLALILPQLGDMLIRIGMCILPIFEHLKLRNHWQIWFSSMRAFAYWRGVRDALGSWRELRRLHFAAPAWPRCRIDVSAGIPTELDLPVDGPFVLEVSFDGALLGEVLIRWPIEHPIREQLCDEVRYKLGAILWEKLRQRPEYAARLGWLEYPQW